MIGELSRWISRTLSVQRALETLLVAPDNTLVILPSTRGALQLTRRLCGLRPCRVTAGPITSSARWRLAPFTRSADQIAIACADFAELQCPVMAFPDQLVGHGASFCPIPFLGSHHWFSTLEATLVLGHRPRVYAVSSHPASGAFALTQLEYEDLLDMSGRTRSLQALMRRLLEPLEQELGKPTCDWLAARCLEQKSESDVRSRLREDLKEVECLLRLHARSVGCDRLGTSAAIAAVVAHEKLLT
jgi:hypothetical protein